MKAGGLSDVMRTIQGVELKNPPACGQPYSSFQISDLVAMEVYRRSAVPMEYRGEGTDCGLLLLWTKRGRRQGTA